MEHCTFARQRGIGQLALLFMTMTTGFASPEALAKSVDAVELEALDQLTDLVSSQYQTIPGAVIFRTATPYIRVPADQFGAARKMVADNAQRVCAKEAKHRLLDAYESSPYMTTEKTRGVKFPVETGGSAMIWSDSSGEPARIDQRIEPRIRCNLPKEGLFYVAYDFRPYDNSINRLIEEPDTRRIYWLAPASFPRYADQLPAVSARWQSFKAEQLKLMAADYRAEQQRKQADSAARSEQLQSARDASKNAAASAFVAAVRAPKPIGTTVCTADNWLGQVEQISGAKIKVTILGHALGQLNADRIRGPFEVDNGRVQDAYYLFRGFSQIRFSDESRQLWDDTDRWGVCNYRLS